MRTRSISLVLLATLLLGCQRYLSANAVKNYRFDGFEEPSALLTKQQKDFLWLIQLADEGFPRPDEVFPRAMRERRRDDLMPRLDEPVSDNEFGWILQRYLSGFRNSHTGASVALEPTHVFPYEVWIHHNTWVLRDFPGGVHHGQAIVAINGHATADIEARLGQLIPSESRVYLQRRLVDWGLCRVPEVLRELGICRDRCRLTLELDDGERASLEAIPLEVMRDRQPLPDPPRHPMTWPRPGLVYEALRPNQGYAYLQINRFFDTVAILEGVKEYVKPWLQPLARAYLRGKFRRRRAPGMLADVYDPDVPVLSDYLVTFIARLNAAGIEHLVIDLRNNGGGDFTLGCQLARLLAASGRPLAPYREFIPNTDFARHFFPELFSSAAGEYRARHGRDPEPGALMPFGESCFATLDDPGSPYHIAPDGVRFAGSVYLLADHGTGSAAAMTAVLLQDNRLATTIGTSMTGRASGATTYTPLRLPNTGHPVQMASTFVERPDRARGSHYRPDHWVEQSLEDLERGRDPAFELALEMIEEHRHDGQRRRQSDD